MAPPARIAPPSFRLALLRIATAFALAGMVAACADVEQVGDEGILTRWGGDLLGAGGAVAVDESVEGDAMLAGGEVRFSGITGGDYIGAGGRQIVEGEVGGSMRAAAGELVVMSRIGRNVTLAGGSVLVDEGAVLQGNAYLAGGRVEVTGTIEGHVRAAGGDVLINGTIGGDLNVEGGRLQIGPGASIEGSVRHHVAPEQVEIDPAAQIAGEVTAATPRARPLAVGWWMLRVVWALGFLLAGAVLVALFPGTAVKGARELEARPGSSVVAGLLWLVGIPLMAIVALMTVIGIPLAVILGAAFLIVLYVARAIPAIWLGRLVVRWGTSGRGRIVAAFLVGAVLLLLAGLVPLLGPLVTFAASLLGAGALLMVLRRHPETEPHL